MRRTLDYSVSFINEQLIEFIDGFLLGDGSIYASEGKTHVGRLTCSLEYEEFCTYLMGFLQSYVSTVKKYNSNNMKQGFGFFGTSKFHPDIYKQYQRWYKDGIKIVPNDVRITPLSLMVWYLGDGCLDSTSKNAIRIRLSTDGFDKKYVKLLCSKLSELGIFCHRTAYNRIYIKSKGVPAFFNFIGRKSPVKCYDYKFEVDEWRYDTIRMKEAAKLLNMDYQHLAYLVKIGKVPCYRLQCKGKPRFSKEHIEVIKNTQGEL